MKKVYISSFVSGLIFAIGLGISGMMNPQKVQGFMDIAGEWDPSLILVMGGAVMVTFLAYPLIFKRESPVFEEKFAVPVNKNIDKKVITGSILFGVGWGIGGLCPGPAIASLGTMNPGIIIFVASMLTGFYLQQTIQHLKGQKNCAVPVMDECTVD